MVSGNGHGPWVIGEALMWFLYSEQLYNETLIALECDSSARGVKIQCAKFGI